MKIHEGTQRSKKEHGIFTKKFEESQRLEKEQEVLVKAKEGLAKAIEGKVIYKDYLDAVIEDKCSSFPSVGELMKRCESLVASKEKLKSHLAIIDEKSAQEAADLEKFKEDKMGLLLDYNVRLADLQHNYSEAFVKTMEKKRYMDNIEEKKVEKGCV